MRIFIRSDKNRGVSFAFILILFPFFGLKLLAALQCYPALSNADTSYFAISAVEYERTGIASQPFTTAWSNADTVFYPHGYLYQIALTKLSPLFGYPGIYVSNLVLFAIYTILFFLLCSMTTINCIVAGGALILSMSFIGPSAFRPELLAAILILIWILVMKQLGRTNSYFLEILVSACALVFLGITQPNIGILSAALLSYWMIYNRGAQALPGIALIALLAVLGVAAITELVTGSFLTWLAGIFAFGRTFFSDFGELSFEYLLLSWISGLLRIGVIPAAGLFAYVHFNKLALTENLTEKTLLHGSGLICVVIFSFYSVLYMGIDGDFYYVELFIPISIVVLWRSFNGIRPYAVRTAFLLMLGIAIFAASLSVARNALGTAIDLVRSDTVSFVQIRKKIGSLIGKEPLAIDAIFAPAIEGDAKSLLVGMFNTSSFLDGTLSEIWGEERANLEACVVVLKQSNTSLEAPPSIVGFDLVETTFSSPVRLFGLTIYRTPKGYNYAVYHRVSCR